MFVYVIVNRENLKIYVGKTISTNLNLYFQKKLWDAEHPEKSRGRSHLFSAIRTHGRHNFSIYPLMQHSTNDDLCYWERHFIKTLNTQHPDVGYNICDGGEGRTGPVSESARARLLVAITGRLVSPETRAKIGASQPNTPAQVAARDQTGHKHSPESIAKIKQRRATQVITHSEETRAKMRASAAGRIITPEAKKRMSAAKMGKPWSAARRAAYNKTF